MKYFGEVTMIYAPYASERNRENRQYREPFYIDKRSV